MIDVSFRRDEKAFSPPVREADKKFTREKKKGGTENENKIWRKKGSWRAAETALCMKSLANENGKLGRMNERSTVNIFTMGEWNESEEMG